MKVPLYQTQSNQIRRRVEGAWFYLILQSDWLNTSHGVGETADVVLEHRVAVVMSNHKKEEEVKTHHII